MSEIPGPLRLSRGDLMRQIAALHAQIAIAYGGVGSSPLTGDTRQEILRQIVRLEKQLMNH